MPKLLRLLRVVAALGLALPLVAVASSPASAAPVTSFFADHIRTCTYSYTQGTLDWNPVTVTRLPQVAVAGVLADRNPGTCRPDAGTAFATFTAYIAGQRVDQVTVDLSLSNANSMRRFAFNLSGQANAPIDQVEVRVCRDFGPDLPAFTCGERQLYPRPRFDSAG